MDNKTLEELLELDMAMAQSCMQYQLECKTCPFRYNKDGISICMGVEFHNNLEQIADKHR